jgi:molybdate transport system substrate-binding protein
MIILTAAIVAKLAEEKWVVPASITDIGKVETAIAVRAGDSPVTVDDAAALRDVLRAADAIFIPDTKVSTAGIHVAKVLHQLGIADEVAARLKIFPNGATAMRHLAETDTIRPIGCTQATEIISTEGVVLSGSLPRGCDLSTMYTAAVATRAVGAKHAERLISLLTDAASPELRIAAGFLDPSN